MWTQSTDSAQLTPGHLVLLEEACRVADRLDDLDRLLRAVSEGFEDDVQESEGNEGSLGRMTGLLAEARAQQTALKGMLAELRQGQRTAGGQTGSPAVPGAKAAGGSGVSDLSARIADRRKEAAG
jgi:hypothetical protein